jgi:hypothetical protein
MNFCSISNHHFKAKRLKNPPLPTPLYCFDKIHVFYQKDFFIVECSKDDDRCQSLWFDQEDTALEWALFEAVCGHNYGTIRME